MKEAALHGERARAIIGSACQVLQAARVRGPQPAHALVGLEEDFATLLRDAARVYCQAVSALHGEPPGSRWSPHLVEQLLAQPALWESILARVEEDRAVNHSDLHLAPA